MSLSDDVLDQFQETASISSVVTLEKLDMLNVVINIQHFLGGVQFGLPQSVQFENSQISREALENYFKEFNLDEKFIKAIYLIWGNTKLVSTPSYSTPENEKLINNNKKVPKTKKDTKPTNGDETPKENEDKVE